MYILLMLSCSSCVAQRTELVNNSNLDNISRHHFDECITRLNYLSLIDQRSRNEKVYFEYFLYVRNDSNCDGIYFYRYVSKSMPQPLFRDATGKTYSKYFPFIIMDGKIISIVDKTEKQRQRFLNNNKNKLNEYFGMDKVSEVWNEIIKGHRIIH